MKIYLTTAYPYHPRLNFATTYLQESANDDPFKKHELVEDPKDADVIIFAEHHPYDTYFFRVITNKLYRRYKEKCYLYHDNDYSITFLPTISPSISSYYFDPLFQRSFSYITQIDPNIHIKNTQLNTSKKYLFSFLGASRTNHIRRKILSLNSDNAYLLDTSDKNSWDLSENAKSTYFKLYADICYKSKFILCPAGIGPSSYRLYESLEMGIAPVIISDQWVPSLGPIWEEFSIRISESDINLIPQILKEREEDADILGKLARQAWIDWFAKDKQFHLLAESCLQLHNTRGSINIKNYLNQFKRLLEPFHFKNTLRILKKFFIIYIQ